MFEAIFKIAALVESDGHGQCTFKVSARKEPISEHDFSSLITNLYDQQVTRMLHIGDELTMILHVNLPNHELERTVCVRKDGKFEGAWLPEPTTNLLPLISSTYEHFRQQIIPGNVFTITFHVRRL